MFMKHIQIPVRDFYICIIVSFWRNRKIMYIATTFYGKRKVHCCHHPYHSCYKKSNYGFDDTVITKDGENYFVAYARISNPRVYGHKIQPNQKFKAVTVVSDKTLLNLIFHGD